MSEEFKPWGGTRPAVEDYLYPIFIHACLKTAEKFATQLKHLDYLIKAGVPDADALAKRAATLRMDVASLCNHVIYLEKHKYDDPRIEASVAEDHF